jgi:hypothetical protein
VDINRECLFPCAASALTRPAKRCREASVKIKQASESNCRRRRSANGRLGLHCSLLRPLPRRRSPRSTTSSDSRSVFIRRLSYPLHGRCRSSSCGRHRVTFLSTGSRETHRKSSTSRYLRSRSAFEPCADLVNVRIADVAARHDPHVGGDLDTLERPRTQPFGRRGTESLLIDPEPCGHAKRFRPDHRICVGRRRCRRGVDDSTSSQSTFRGYVRGICASHAGKVHGDSWRQRQPLRTR